jgi:P-type Cu+ transporter
MMAVDPVCGMDVQPDKAAAVSEYKGQAYYFCAPGCKQKFDADPDRYLDAAAEPAGTEAMEKQGFWAKLFKG